MGSKKTPMFFPYCLKNKHFQYDFGLAHYLAFPPRNLLIESAP